MAAFIAHEAIGLLQYLLYICIFLADWLINYKCVHKIYAAIKCIVLSCCGILFYCRCGFMCNKIK